MRLTTLIDPLDDDQYRQLLGLRTGLRRFLHWSEEKARRAGLTAGQHQLLLAIRGHGDPRGPTVSDVASSLLLRHHSAVELTQRAEALGLLDRRPDPEDGRLVRLSLTRKGANALARLSSLHLEELGRLADDLRPLWGGLGPSEMPGGRADRDAGGPEAGGPPARVTAVDATSVATETSGRGVCWSLGGPGELNANVARLDPGDEVGEHAADVDVLIVTLAGAGTVEVDAEEVALHPGVVAHVPRGVRRTLRASGDSDGLGYLTVHRRRPGPQIASRPTA